MRIWNVSRALLLASLLCGLLLLLIGAPQGRLLRRSTTSCPPIIAHSGDGSYSIRGKGSPYLCLRSRREAERAGFMPKGEQRRQSYTDWWRLAVNKTADTCSSIQRQNAPVTIFLQIGDTEAGVFGQICGLNSTQLDDRFSGVRTDSGFSVSASEQLQSERCEGGIAEVTSNILFMGARRSKVNQVRYTRITRCIGLEDTAPPCIHEFSGEAFRETAHQFPPVPERLQEFSSSCAVTLNTCLECHS